MKYRKYRINEIFYSLQGEGHHTGKACIFIRFSGCNLHCSFCDTDHRHGMELSKRQIYEELKKYKTDVIVLTGGEPALQVDIPFLKFFRKKGYFLHIETNGTIALNESKEYLDWITVSPKSNTVIRQTEGNELKLVCQGQDIKNFQDYFLPEKELKFEHYYIQPCSQQKTEEIIKMIKEAPKWKLSTQMQKIWNIR